MSDTNDRVPQRPRAHKVPVGLELCPTCGEYRGAARWRDLNWDFYVPGDDDTERDRLIQVRCLCEGIPCPRCGRKMIHRPGSNSYDPEQNTVEHWPVLPCAPHCGCANQAKD